MAMDEDQLSGLINAAVTEAVERTRSELTALFHAETSGLKESRDRILSEKKALEGKDTKFDAAEQSADETRERSKRLDKAVDRFLSRGFSSPTPASAEAPEEIVLRRGQFTPREYREAKERGEREGKPVRVLYEDPEDMPADSPVEVIETDDMLFVNKGYRERVGVLQLDEIARSKGKHIQLFRTRDDLPDEVATKHDQILAGKDPDTPVSEGDSK